MTQANHLLMRALGIICDVNDYHVFLEWRNVVCGVELEVPLRKGEVDAL